MSSSYGITFWGYRKGSRANSNYEFISIKHIKCYFPQKIRLRCNSVNPPPPPIEIDGNLEFEMAHILDSKLDR